MDWIVEFKLGLLAVWFLAIFGLERIAPCAPWPQKTGRIFRNGALWLIVVLISPLIVLPIALWASEHALWVRPDLPAVSFLIDVAILDLTAFLLHRAYHEVPVLWRLHQPHHLDRFLDATSAVRFHAGEVVFSALVRAPVIIVLAVPFTHVVIFELCLLGAAIFYHSNLRLPRGVEGVLAQFIVTPSIHWVHHHRAWADTNSNYGAIFSFWDRLFRTKSPTRRTPEMEIGVPGVEEKTAIGLLLAPFQRSDSI